MSSLRREWYQLIAGTSKYRLLTLQSEAPLTIHLSDDYIESDKKVKALLDNLEDSYVVLVNGDRGAEVAQSRLQVLPTFLESALDMKYRSQSIPSITHLIIWDFWSVSYPLTLELLRRPWKQVDVFAIRFDWST